ncbi:MAG TPA: pyrrolo-quinoline quinone [Phycisphaerae bacterium]|nr:pyrrolo-quinoline quinone [Phycisphaerae bacterium]
MAKILKIRLFETAVHALLAALVVVLAGPVETSAQDWSQWGGSTGRNMVCTKGEFPVNFIPGRLDGQGRIDPATTRNVAWVAKLGTHTYGNPVVAEGRVLVGVNDAALRDSRFKRTKGGMLLCFDEKSGKRLWHLVVPRLTEKIDDNEFDDMDLGICSSPTVADGRVYVVTNRCEVLCLDIKGLDDGNEGPFLDESRYMQGPGAGKLTQVAGLADIIWRYDMFHKLGIAPHDASNCSPLLVDGVLYVATSNGCDRRWGVDVAPRPNAPSLVAIDAKTGKLLAVDDVGLGRKFFHGQWSSPSAGKVAGKWQIYYGGGDGVLYAFEHVEKVPAKPARNAKPATLKKIWSFDCNPPDFKVREGKKIDYWEGDLSRNNDKPRTYKGPNEIIATPVFFKGRVYIATGRDPVHGLAAAVLYCIDASGKGDVTATAGVWSYKKIVRSISSVTIADGLLYAADLAGVLHCVDAANGRGIWTHKTKSEIWATPMVADGKIYLGGLDRNLWVFQAGRKKKQLAKIRLRAPICTTPVGANSTLYIATDKRLYAVKTIDNKKAQ